LEVSVPEVYSADLAPGLAAVIEASGTLLNGAVRRVSPEIKDGALSVRVQFSAPPPDMRQNQRLNVRIQFDQRKQVLLLPRGEFLNSEGGRFVWRKTDTALERVAIVTGAVSTENIEVQSGLKVGDEVVVSTLTRPTSLARLELL
jgi:HlyD family secretion protein